MTTVAAGSPAAAAGIEPNDVLTKLDGRPLAGQLDWCFALIGRKPRESLKLDLLRGGKPLQVSLVLGDRPKPDGAAILKAKYGLTAVPLDKAKAEATALARASRRRRYRRGERTAVELRKAEIAAAARRRARPIDSIRPRDLDHVGLLLDRIPPKRKIVMVLLRRTGDTVTRVDLTTVSP